MKYYTVSNSWKRWRRGLERIQRGFENQYDEYGRLKREDIKALDYETLQAWKRLERHIL
jgi:hypothetical protein